MFIARKMRRVLDPLLRYLGGQRRIAFGRALFEMPRCGSFELVSTAEYWWNNEKPCHSDVVYATVLRQG